jgi:hypothetical protein
LTTFFNSFDEATRAKLCESLVAEDGKRRGPLMERIFAAMDTSGDGVRAAGAAVVQPCRPVCLHVLLWGSTRLIDLPLAESQRGRARQL